LKDLKLKPKQVVIATSELITKLEQAKSLETAGVDYARLEGQKKGENYYRIRLGEWRIGIEYFHPKIILLRIIARGDMYKHFPPK
jgi:mRNA interferase RelE/StbE